MQRCMATKLCYPATVPFPDRCPQRKYRYPGIRYGYHPTYDDDDGTADGDDNGHRVAYPNRADTDVMELEMRAN